ncbi:transposase (plasmid) [Streptomyces sp. NBC_01727]|nr:transposase [Streptomyces sp. NBC_01727]
MRAAVSVCEGAISSCTLLKRLRSGSRKNATYAAFREVGRVIRTVQLLRYLSDELLLDLALDCLQRVLSPTSSPPPGISQVSVR